ncbi:MAG: cytochrome c biogenesis protein ResB [Defluviitaleaceae bacterium]|nr:cytochrome c biogenesis protein ResB [Defluviitaleaceae bacterium]
MIIPLWLFDTLMVLLIISLLISAAYCISRMLKAYKKLKRTKPPKRDSRYPKTTVTEVADLFQRKI